MGLFGLFGTKPKKFGLQEALIVLQVKSDVTPEGAKTGVAFVEALGIPVTVLPESEEKTRAVKNAVVETAAEIEDLGKMIADAEKEGRAIVAELQTKLQEKVQEMVGRIGEKIRAMEGKIGVKIDKLYKKIDDLYFKKESKTVELEAYRDEMVAELQAEVKKAVAAAQTETNRKIWRLGEQIVDAKDLVEEYTEELKSLDNVKKVFG